MEFVLGAIVLCIGVLIGAGIANMTNKSQDKS